MKKYGVSIVVAICLMLVIVVAAYAGSQRYYTSCRKQSCTSCSIVSEDWVLDNGVNPDISANKAIVGRFSPVACCATDIYF